MSIAIVAESAVSIVEPLWLILAKQKKRKETIVKKL